ncbi:MAG TPA: hypothetical protein VEF04_01450, partial [Blastocatellia bacterium]|nr:hypothetical protein [Blastocatellia bacterium]
QGAAGSMSSQQIPPAVMQKFTKPLSLEDINKLPPETRDFILRAQGRLPASPAPKATPKK